MTDMSDLKLFNIKTAVMLAKKSADLETVKAVVAVHAHDLLIAGPGRSRHQRS